MSRNLLLLFTDITVNKARDIITYVWSKDAFA